MIIKEKDDSDVADAYYKQLEERRKKKMTFNYLWFM